MIADDPDKGPYYDHDDAPPPTTIPRVWAPDHMVQQLAGPFAAYSKFTELPRAMRLAPDAKTWAAVELWQWWPPTSSFAARAGGGGGGEDNRVVCHRDGWLQRTYIHTKSAGLLFYNLCQSAVGSRQHSYIPSVQLLINKLSRTLHVTRQPSMSAQGLSNALLSARHSSLVRFESSHLPPSWCQTSSESTRSRVQ